MTKDQGPGAELTEEDRVTCYLYCSDKTKITKMTTNGHYAGTKRHKTSRHRTAVSRNVTTDELNIIHLQVR